MHATRFQEISGRYPQLRIAAVGDFCLDRYLEIDPSREETSLETGLPVHNVMRVRAMPGGAGTVLNNLTALGIGTIFPVGFCGVDGEGYELRRALSDLPQVKLDHFFETPWRRTFTYCKPLVMHPGQPPQELSRLDSKNWTATPLEVQARLAEAIKGLGGQVDAVVLLEQVNIAESGVLGQTVLAAVAALQQKYPQLPIIADSRRGLRGFPPVMYKMNRAEFGELTGMNLSSDLQNLAPLVSGFARSLGNRLFVTAADQGILGASADGRIDHVPALPLRGPIDIVGAGDAVTANLISALTAGAEMREALEIATAAASVVIHKLGVTGTASPSEIRSLLAMQ